MSELSINLFEYYVIVFFLSIGGGKRVYFIFYIEGGILGMLFSYMLKLCNELIFLVFLMLMFLFFVWI